MLSFSDEFEKRRNKVNSVIKSLQAKEDKNILQAIYSVSNIQDNHYDEDKLNKVNKTFFTDMPMKELLSHFKKENFNNKGAKYYEELFQEIYNRQAKDNGYEPRYLVEVSGDAATTNGFMRHGTNMLNINAGMIEKYKKVDEFTDNADRKNATTIGAHSLLTLVHETQHTFQSEGIMKFALGEDDENLHDKRRNAICLARMSLSNYLHYNGDMNNEDDKKIYDLLRNTYWFDYMEHDSNMAPVKFLNKHIKNGNITDEVFIKAGKQRAVNDIHINKVTDQSEIPSTLQERAEKMEEVIQGYYKYFKEKMKDGKIKDQVCEVLEGYLKADSEGKSEFNKDITKDFDMCLKFMGINKKISRKAEDKNQEELANI